MAINIKFDLAGNPEPPTIILATRSGKELGQLNVNVDSINLNDEFNNASELTFTLNKYIDGKLTNLWDKVVDFKLIYCKEWDCWFEIKVEIDEESETVKTVFCTELGQAELSQIMLYNIEINTEKDIERDDYKVCTLWNSDSECSILDRLLKDKAPHYHIWHVDSTIRNIQRSFSFDDISIYDAFEKIAEEIGCLFVYDAGLTRYIVSGTAMPSWFYRRIYVYDLQQYCNECGHRGEFTNKCPKCGSTNITNGYGNDTSIFVTSDELASSGIQLASDTDSVKNCFKLEAGDDLMTATIRNCNPNGTDYIWRFSDLMKEDMSDELVEKLESYDELYQQYYNDHISNIDTELLDEYNALVSKYSKYNDDLQEIQTPITGYSDLMNAYYNTIDLALYLKSGLMPNVKISETSAEEQAKLLTASSLSPVAVANIDTVSLTTMDSAVLAMAKTIVKSTYKVQIDASKMYSYTNGKKYWQGNFIVSNYSDVEDTAISATVSVEVNDELESFVKQKIEKVLNKENADDLSISSLFKKEIKISEDGKHEIDDNCDFCKELKKYALNPLISFRDACQSCIDILIEQGIGIGNDFDDNSEYVTWKTLYKSSSVTTSQEYATGYSKTIHLSDSKPFFKDGDVIRLTVDGESEIFTVVGTSDTGSIGNYYAVTDSEVVDENDNGYDYYVRAGRLLLFYGYETNFYSRKPGTYSVEIELQTGNLYDDLYVPYYAKLMAIEAEIKLRESEIGIISGVYDLDGNLITDGLQSYIEKCRNQIHDALNFEEYLGEALWQEFCAYRREDKYSNDNYISDGLNNAELFKKALEFFEVAENEIYKSSELQCSISTTLNNLLAIPKFKPLIKAFNVGNWIRVQIDEKIYKLRLLKYEIDFGDFDNIPVEFSDVTKIKNSITDVKSVLSQASSMATSYSSVQRQASQGEKSNTVLDNWIESGLNATNTKIVGAGNQSQVWDKNGILCRQYDPITDAYSDEQLKIINSTIAITDNNWETTKTAIGKYFYTDPNTGELKSTYGVNGETIVGKILIGEELNILNDSGNLEFGSEGLVVKNDKNTVAINPSNPSIFNIKNNDENIFSLDENGQLVIIGNITASGLTLLDGTSIGTEKITGLSDVALSGEYGDLNGAPTKLSDFENDSGFIAKDVNNLTNYYKKTESDNLLKSKANTSDLADVATSGSYTDLKDIDELKNWVLEQIQSALDNNS